MAHLSSIPQMIPFPPTHLRTNIPPEDWTTCLEGWSVLARAHLSSSSQDFQNVIAEPQTSLLSFLTSYVDSMGKTYSDVNYMKASRHQGLHRDVFLLVHRILVEAGQPPPSMLQWTFLGNFSRVYRHSESLKPLLEQAWAKYASHIEPSFRKYKDSLVVRLDKGNPLTDDEHFSPCLLPLARACSATGTVIMTGSDLLDSLFSAYLKQPPGSQSKLLLLLYLGLNALLVGERPNHSLLFDHLYSLKTASESKFGNPQQPSLLSDLVTNTPLLGRLRKYIQGADSARASTLIDSLESFRQGQRMQPKKQIRRNIDKGKNRANDEYGHGAFHSIHVHRMSLITQIQELFPHLGSAFVVKLLDAYNDNVEKVTAHLLEDSLPPNLRNTDWSETLAIRHPPATGLAPDLVPRSTPPSSPSRERRNVFDDDDFDRLAIDTSRLQFGRKNPSLTADSLLSTRDEQSRNTSKAAILSALAAFDADDDEHDDTYDLEDVGGTVDSAARGGEDADAYTDELRDRNEEALFSAFSTSPELFERDSATRRGQPRQALKSETGMTDEQIEGWGIQVKRDPRRLRRMEAKYATFAGQQRELGGSAWRGESGTEDSEASGAEGGRGGFSGSGRGRGRGGPGRARGAGAGVAGPAGEKGTQVSRQRKEAGKGSRANHNRRDQRARKMARGGFAG